MQDISPSKNLTVIAGLGKTGLACVKFLTQLGIPIAVTDTRLAPPGLAELRDQFPQIPVSLGKLDPNLLVQATEIVLSPGLSLKEPAITHCLANNIPVIGDIELFARLAKAPICGITGSNAKSTVTSLVTEMAKTAGLNVRMGGNIGTPALALLESHEPDLYVLELSSFQLETTYTLKSAAATILNISPDHLDRYPNVEAYIEAKQRIYHHCDYIVTNRDDTQTLSPFPAKKAQFSFGLGTPKMGEFGMLKKGGAWWLAFGDAPLLSIADVTIKGQHNWANALAALALGYSLQFPMAAMLETLKHFKGLPHRCQWVAKSKGITWYNDSKGTNVGSAVAAIEGLGTEISGKLVLIAGGLGKGADFSVLRDSVKRFVRAVILIGEDAPKIAEALHNTVILIFAKNMEEAVAYANGQAQENDAVLLSPACASFDMFNNFEHRGEVFMQIVKELLI